jgi:DNA repair exonuclease SbcCD ATPase subunit
VQDRRLLERITEPGYLDGLTERPLGELKQMRAECSAVESELSFDRRLCQARIEILKAELDRRRSGSQRDLIERLPEVLSGPVSRRDTPLPERAPDFPIPRTTEVPRRGGEGIAGEQAFARLVHLTVEEIEQMARALEEQERELSESRKAIHEVLDAIQAEIVRRYKSGEADPTAALRDPP